MLHKLSLDPYGVFAVVLTPTRELAIQIREQFQIFGAPMHVRECLVVGGLSMLAQSLELQKRPHVIIGTPGRVAAHIKGGEEYYDMYLHSFLACDIYDIDIYIYIAFSLSQYIYSIPSTFMSAIVLARERLLTSCSLNGFT